MNCKNCFKNLNKMTKYCPYCGALTEVGTILNSNGDVISEYTEFLESKNKRKKIENIGLIVGVILVIMIIVFVIFLTV